MMKIVRTIEEIRNEVELYCTSAGGPIALVPTMGYLHQGHASLIERARNECGLVIVSIFVNPLQFGPNEDFDRYPRDAERDAAVAGQAGANLIFMPSVEEIYPQFPAQTKVSVSGLTSKLCGASRPGHFDGVATVVMKLFNIIKPDKAYFGLKDAQQVAVIQQMVSDLNLDVKIVPCPTVREADGLAMSSRNVYLSEEQRKQALVLNAALSRAHERIREGRWTIDRLKGEISAMIAASPLAEIDYVEILQYPDLSEPPQQTPVAELAGDTVLLLALAVKFGGTRLIDNRIVLLSEVFTHV